MITTFALRVVRSSKPEEYHIFHFPSLASWRTLGSAIDHWIVLEVSVGVSSGLAAWRCQPDGGEGVDDCAEAPQPHNAAARARMRTRAIASATARMACDMRYSWPQPNSV